MTCFLHLTISRRRPQEFETFLGSRIHLRLTIKSGALLCRGPLEFLLKTFGQMEETVSCVPARLHDKTNTRTKQEYTGSGKETQAMTVKQFLTKRISVDESNPFEHC